MSQSLTETIKALELMLLEPAVRRSAEKLDELLSDVFQEFGSSGKIFTKKHILSNLLPISTKYTIQNYTITQLSADIALATYRTEESLPEINQVNTTLRSSLWQKKASQWQMVFHQATKATL